MKHVTESKLDIKQQSYEVVKIGILIMKLLIVYLVVYTYLLFNLTLNDMQINE